MSVVKQPNPDEYFKNSTSTVVSGVGGDVNAKAEQDNLYPGDTTDIEVWLKYKKFILQQKNEDSERILREKNAKKAYNFSVNWAMFIGFIIIVHGTVINFLTEKEFLFVIGALTASILTYYLLVIKYLFYRPKEKNQTD
jgi:hypothetical protein